ncbi:flavin-containing monooxygenase [Brevibacillus sp. SYSU BS000544]|uniref:flavin-containing monooxygenase n=1 Tax=Brevibacillus sp. SYSU BS000544 TaxID=3416443 RepID=UPI003CE46947
MSNIFDCVVIGGGQAGLAAGYYLQREGIRFIILEAGNTPAGSWPHYYDSLTLFSPSRFSSLPEIEFPGDPNHYPTRNEVIEYLQDYAAHFNFPIRTNTFVTDISKQKDLFLITSSSGETFESKHVISASGGFSRPFIPQISGMDQFQGQILHSKDYKNTAPFKGHRVIVVGAGNSAVQIAVELSNDAQVTIATKSPIKFVPQTFLGKDLHFWITSLGLDHSQSGLVKRILHAKSVGVLDTGKYQQAINRQKPNQNKMFTTFSSNGVIWSDGTEEKVDTVIFATGYQADVSYLSSLGALDSQGSPLHNNGISSTVKGLYYVGLPWQRSHASATIRGVGPDSAYVVNHIKKETARKSSCC